MVVRGAPAPPERGRLLLWWWSSSSLSPNRSGTAAFLLIVGSSPRWREQKDSAAFGVTKRVGVGVERVCKSLI